jgi:hypothetical protein
MNLAFEHLLPDNFSPNSRVWIYQSNRLFSLNEAFAIEDQINQFCYAWRSHGAEVKATGLLLFGQFIILMSDETEVGVSGCSTDSSVRFIKDLGQQYHVDFFDRTSLAFFIKDKIQILPMAQLNYALENEFINGETLYFNNLVQTKAELQSSWIIPAKNSWLAKKLHKTT